MTAGDEPVPFVDVAAMNAQSRSDLDRLWDQVIATSGFVGGPAVSEFESEFAWYCRAAHCVGVGSGTDALELIFAGLGIGRGDEVVVPANTFVATAAAVVSVGATPVFVDVDPHTLLITAEGVRAAITPRTVAVVAVHLYGAMPDMAALMAVAERAGIAVVEDAAQAHGSTLLGRPAGSWGRAAAFSFYPGKNLGAFGDAGAVVTDDTELAARVRCLADHGRSTRSRYVHEHVGRNSRIDALQAAVVRTKLARLDNWNVARRAAAARYREQLRGVDARLVEPAPEVESAYHLLVVRVAERDSVLRALEARRIASGVHYPVPCHQQPAFHRSSSLSLSLSLPVAEAAAREVVSLPLFPTITNTQIERVVEALAVATEECAYVTSG